jgi:hypothetical protein
MIFIASMMQTRVFSSILVPTSTNGFALGRGRPVEGAHHRRLHVGDSRLLDRGRARKRGAWAPGTGIGGVETDSAGTKGGFEPRLSRRPAAHLAPPDLQLETLLLDREFGELRAFHQVDDLLDLFKVQRRPLLKMLDA